MSTLSDLQSAQARMNNPVNLPGAIDAALAPPSPNGTPSTILARAKAYEAAAAQCMRVEGDIKNVATGDLPSAWQGAVATTAAQVVNALSMEVGHTYSVLTEAARILRQWASDLRTAQAKDQNGIGLLHQANALCLGPGMRFGLCTNPEARQKALGGVNARVAAAQSADECATSTANQLNALTSQARAAHAKAGSDPLGAVVLATEYAATARPTAPHIAIGPLSSNGQDISQHTCTAFVIGKLPNGDILVMTAGHCGGSTNYSFAPAYDNGNAPYGVWTSVGQPYRSPGWTNSHDINNGTPYDYSIIEMRLDHNDSRYPKNRDITDGQIQEVGNSALKIDHAPMVPQDVTVTGYGHGSNVPISARNTAGHALPFTLTTNMTGLPSGTSGSPWLDANGDVIGIIGGQGQGLPAADPRNYSSYPIDPNDQLANHASGGGH